MIDVCSNASNPEEKKDAGDVKQGEIVSHLVNSSSPSFPMSLFAPHLTAQLPRNVRSRSYVQRYALGAVHSGISRGLGVITSPSTSSMIVHPRSHSPSAGPPVGSGSSPPPRDLIRIDSDDGIGGQARSSPLDTDNDDGMNDMVSVQGRISRVDTDNDIEFNVDGVDDEDDIVDID